MVAARRSADWQSMCSIQGCRVQAGAGQAAAAVRCCSRRACGYACCARAPASASLCSMAAGASAGKAGSWPSLAQQRCVTAGEKAAGSGTQLAHALRFSNGLRTRSAPAHCRAGCAMYLCRCTGDHGHTDGSMRCSCAASLAAELRMVCSMASECTAGHVGAHQS